jgi:hypothetical protein
MAAADRSRLMRAQTTGASDASQANPKGRPNMDEQPERPTRSDPAPPDEQVSGSSQLGQVVIVTARWLLIITGFVVTLWNPTQANINPVRITLLVLFGLAIANFFLHAQILKRRPIERPILYAASAADLGIITLIVAAYGGLTSSSFVYYYPALLALALVFPLAVTGYFAGGLVLAYAVVSLPAHFTEMDLQVLFARLISFVAVCVIGYVYQGIEHRRYERTTEDERFGLRVDAPLA